MFFFVFHINEVICGKSPFICLEKCRCSEILSTFVVDCSNAGLECVPKAIPSRTTRLNLSNNEIKVLHNDSSVQSEEGGFPNLTTMSIRSNQLNKIEINAFRGLYNLKMLDLYNNSLEMNDSYPKSVFIPFCQSLDVFDIRRNLLGNIFQVNYPASVGELVGLKELRIDSLRNKSLPTEYGNLKDLKKLSFTAGRKELGFIKNDMFHAVFALNITEIDLAGLDIGVIDNNTFLYLPRLTALDLSNNGVLGKRIENIIPSLKKTSLETLKLNNTGIGREEIITPILQKLSELNLKKLTFDNNSMYNFCLKFSEHFPRLEVVSFGNNLLGSFIHLRYDILEMKHLVGLNVSWQYKYSKQTTVGPISNGNSSHLGAGVICQLGMACPLILPPKLQWLDMAHSSYGTIRLPEFVFLVNNSFKSIDVSYNGIHLIEKPIYCVKTNTSSVVLQVEIMNINNNALQCITSEFLKHCDWSSLKHAYLRNNKLGQTEGNICNTNKNNILGFLKPAMNLEVLDLAGNQIRNRKLLSDIRFLSKLKEVDLSFNGFHNVSVVLQNLTELSTLNFSNNNIGCLSLSTILQLNKLQNQEQEPEKIEVDLSGNLLSCSCECFNFFEWMMATTVAFTDMYNYECKFDDGQKESLNELAFIVAKLESQCFGTRWLKICFSLQAVINFLIILVCVAYRRRHDIKYFILKIKLNRHKLKRILDTQTYTYSAFISCDHRDAKLFVYRKFLPNLETPETKLRFCIAQRNFLVGATILDNIMRAINKSKKVIFIVSEYFMTSKWCQEELMIAHRVSSL